MREDFFRFGWIGLTSRKLRYPPLGKNKFIDSNMPFEGDMRSFPAGYRLPGLEIFWFKGKGLSCLDVRILKNVRTWVVGLPGG